MSTGTERPERTHPLIWTVGLLAIAAVLIGVFVRFYGSGAAKGRNQGPLQAKPKPAAPIDHLALIADRSQDVLDRGAIVWAKNCASCHGKSGNENPSNMNPPPRNFHKDAFKNPNGGGPYALYQVVTNGYAGRMPGFAASIPTEERYAVTHYLREVLVKPNHAEGYVEKDSDAVAKTIPKPGAAGEGPRTPPAQVPPPKDIQPLMKGVATETAPVVASADAWLARARAQAGDGRVAAALAALQLRLAGTAALVELQRAVGAADTARARSLLLEPTQGAFVADVALLTAPEFDGLLAQLRQAAPGGR